MSSPLGPSMVGGAEQQPVVAAQPDRRLPVAVEAQDDVLVDLADQHHLRDLDGVGVGDAQPADELDRHVQPLHVGVMSGPPPWTTIGLSPTYFSSTTSRANSSRSSGSVIAAPPYLITTVLPWNSRM